MGLQQDRSNEVGGLNFHARMGSVWSYVILNRQHGLMFRVSPPLLSALVGLVFSILYPMKHNNDITKVAKQMIIALKPYSNV
jgi:hypothetical protein